MSSLQWCGPYNLGEMIVVFSDPHTAWIEHSEMYPKETMGVYIVTEGHWVGEPKGVLYVGESGNLLNRLGAFWRDLFGFWHKKAGAHPGGRSVWNYLYDSKKSITGLYLAWAPVQVGCWKCEEQRLIDFYPDSLNKVKKRSHVCFTLDDDESVDVPLLDVVD